MPGFFSGDLQPSILQTLFWNPHRMLEVCAIVGYLHRADTSTRVNDKYMNAFATSNPFQVAVYKLD